VSYLLCRACNADLSVFYNKVIYFKVMLLKYFYLISPLVIKSLFDKVPCWHIARMSLTLLALFSFSQKATAEVTITELQALKFPTVLKKFTTRTIVEVNWKGQITNNTNTSLLDDDYYQGRYLITSDSNLPINLDFHSLDNEPFVALKRIRVRYKNKTYKSFPALSLPNPGIDGEIIEIGAKLVSRKNASPGLKLPQYLISVHEQ
jgi:hypothetical protein